MTLENDRYLFFRCSLLPSPPLLLPFIYTHFSCSDKMVKGLEHGASLQIGLMETRIPLLEMEAGYKIG